MNLFKNMLFLTIVLLLLQSQIARTQVSDNRPNVLFIIVDDLNDYVSGLDGHPQARTPNISKLAQSGVFFKNAYTNCPLCSPSRSSLFTGIYPHNSKKFTNESKWFNNPVLKNCKTLMEYFDENGYYVTGSGKLLHSNLKKLWDEWGVDVNNYGPFAYDGNKTVGHPSVPEPFRSIGAVDGSFAPLSCVPTFPDSVSQGRQTGWIYSTWGGKDKKEGEFLKYVDPDHRDLMPDEMHAQWAVKKIEALEKRKDLQPFFMGVGFVRPHTPLYAPQKYFDMFPLEEIQLPVILEGDNRDTYYDLVYCNEKKEISDYRNPMVRIPNTKKGPLYYRTLKASYPDIKTGLKHFLQAYLACIAFVDDQIGIVLNALNNSRFRENTIVVLVSDHGWNMGEKEYLFKNSLWEESTRVPLIIRAPGFSVPGLEIDHPVSLIDIYPTLVDLCNLRGNTMKNDMGGHLDGYSLKPFLQDPECKNWKGPNGALTVVYGGLNNENIYKQSYSYRTKDWRYIRYYNGLEELYFHKGDPYEWHNLAYDKRFIEVKMKLKEQLMKLLKNKHSE